VSSSSTSSADKQKQQKPQKPQKRQRKPRRASVEKGPSHAPEDPPVMENRIEEGLGHGAARRAARAKPGAAKPAAAKPAAGGSAAAPFAVVSPMAGPPIRPPAVLSAATVQNLADELAAKMGAALAGFAAESTAKTKPWLKDQLQGASGQDALAALSAALMPVDRFGYPESANDQLDYLTGRADLGGAVAQILAYVKSPAGGGYPTFGSYLKANAGSVHPLFAELMRLKGTDPITDPVKPGVPVGVFAPAYQVKAPDRLLAGADGALVDLTTAAGNATPADMAIFLANNDRLYIRSRLPFAQMVLALSTLAGGSINPVFEYWNGYAYTVLPNVSDYTTGFTKNDVIAWNVPPDWEPYHKDHLGNVLPAQERLYTLSIQRTAASVTPPPVGTCLSLVPVPVVSGGSGSYHRGVAQPCLSLLRITGPNALSVLDGVEPDITQFVPPAIRLKALTALGASVTFVASYVNQDGLTQTQAQAAWSSPAALSTTPVVLATGDTGVQDVLDTGWTATVAAGGVGVVAVEVAPLRSPVV
jgi:hypothetical protein